MQRGGPSRPLPRQSEWINFQRSGAIWDMGMYSFGLVAYLLVSNASYSNCVKLNDPPLERDLLNAAKYAVQLRTRRPIRILKWSIKIEACRDEYQIFFFEDFRGLQPAWLVHVNDEMTTLRIHPPE